MQEATPTTSAITDDDDARLASLGYNPQLNRVLGLFSNFSVAFTYARDGALPGAKWISMVHPRFKTPVNALLGGAVVTLLFVLLEFVSPTHNVRILWFDYPANTNALVSLVSFATSGIYLSFLLTVIVAALARARGWVPE